MLYNSRSIKKQNWSNENSNGNNSDGSKSKDYCKYCYENGAFTSEWTMDEMIEFCIPSMVETNSAMTEDEDRSIMKKFLPTLKRWKTA